MDSPNGTFADQAIDLFYRLEEIFLDNGKYFFYAGLAIVAANFLREGYKALGRDRSGVKKWIGVLDDAICGGEKAVAFVAMFLMTGIVFAQVALEFISDQLSLNWNEELATYLLIWTGFLGASIATKDGRHLSIDIIPRLLVEGSKTRKFVEKGSTVVASAFCVFLVWISYEFVSYTEAVSQSSMSVPLRTVQTIIPITFAIMAFRFFGQLFGWIDPRPESDDGPLAKSSQEEDSDDPKSKVAVKSAKPGIMSRKGMKWIVAFAAVAAIQLLFRGFALEDGPAGWAIALTFAILFFSGIPLFAVLGIATALCILYLIPGANLLVIPKKIFYTSDVFELVAIPCFVMAGSIMTNGGIARRLIEFAQSLVGWLPGGLAIAAIFGCMFFAAISGSSPVTVVAIGTMMYPAMKRDGYSDNFSLGLVTSAGSLGILIPPSIPMIIFAIVAQQSPKDLFMAGVFPGLLIGAMLSIYAIYTGIRTPGVKTMPFSVKQVGVKFFSGIWGIMLPVVVLGGIYSGHFGVTQAAAVSVVYALIVEVLIHRETKLKELPKLFVQAAVDMGTIIIVIAIAQGFAEFITTLGIPQRLADFVSANVESKVAFLLLLNVILLITGALMDIVSAILILTPLFLPIATIFGIDPIHLGIIFIVNLEIGYLTPPLGINLFVSSIIFNVEIFRVVKAVVRFTFIFLLALLVISYFPAISTDLPQRMSQSANEEFRRGSPTSPAGPTKKMDLKAIMNRAAQSAEEDQPEETPPAPKKMDLKAIMERAKQKDEANREKAEEEADESEAKEGGSQRAPITPPRPGQRAQAPVPPDAPSPATVNGEPIDGVDFLRLVQGFCAQRGCAGEEQKKAVEAMILDRMVSQILLKKEIQRRGLTAPDEEVRQRMETMIEKMGGQERFGQMLEHSGRTLDQFKEEIRSGLAGNKMALDIRAKAESEGENPQEAIREFLDNLKSEADIEYAD